MTSVILLLATAGLLALPMWGRSRGERLPPAEWAKLNSWTLASGVLLLEAALVECASPVISSLLGGSKGHHFFPGGAVAGWLSLSLALLIPGSWLVGIAGTLRRRRKLRAEPWVGTHYAVDGYDVVLLPSPEDLALSLPGRPGQVLLSKSLFASLSAAQLRAVVRHEIAHLEHRHSRYFLLLAALHPMSHVVPVLRSSLQVLKLSLESWADRVACRTREERRRVREAIVTLSAPDVGVGIATLTDTERRHERIRLLEAPTESAVEARMRTSLYVTAFLLAVGALAAVVMWWI